MIKNIIFDLGGVVLKDNPSTILNKLTLDDETKIKIDNLFFKKISILDIGEKTIEETINNNFELRDLPTEIKEILLKYYEYREYNENVLMFMKLLKKLNYKIYILSNNNKETGNYLKKQSIFENIDGWVISADYKEVKPNTSIYKILLKKFNLKEEECFFIDDNDKNISTAEKLNIKAKKFDNNIDEIIMTIQNVNNYL